MHDERCYVKLAQITLGSRPHPTRLGLGRRRGHGADWAAEEPAPPGLLVRCFANGRFGHIPQEMELEELDLDGLLARTRKIRSKARETRSESRQAREEYKIAHLYHEAVMIEMRRARDRRALTKPLSER
jgi:hypothetical protein